jgi:hypothetical protein
MLRDLSFDFGAPEQALRIWYDAEERTFQREERTVRAPPRRPLSAACFATSQPWDELFALLQVRVGTSVIFDGERRGVVLMKDEEEVDGLLLVIKRFKYAEDGEDQLMDEAKVRPPAGRRGPNRFRVGVQQPRRPHPARCTACSAPAQPRAQRATTQHSPPSAGRGTRAPLCRAVPGRAGPRARRVLPALPPGVDLQPHATRRVPGSGRRAIAPGL